MLARKLLTIKRKYQIDPTMMKKKRASRTVIMHRNKLIAELSKPPASFSITQLAEVFGLSEEAICEIIG